MSIYLITFRSLTHAQRAARLLERGGLTATVMKAPQGLSSSGCAYAVTLRGHPGEALSRLRGTGLRIGKVFRREADSSYTEVAL